MAIVLLLFVVALSMAITKVAATALMLTGMSPDSAQFQARSAYSGVGFTTSESEALLTHPVRRKIIMLLMLLGNAGIATVVATLIVSFSSSQQSVSWTICVIAVGISCIYFVANSKWLDERLSLLIEWALKRFTNLEVHDYRALLQLSKGYTVVEIVVKEGDWLEDESLATLALPQEGVIVLGVRREDGTYIGAPVGKTIVRRHDTLTLYGKLDRIEELNNRRSGVVGVFARQVAIKEHVEEVREEEDEIVVSGETALHPAGEK